jgi:imidazolonepropionase-like amidohydrolase
LDLRITRRAHQFGIPIVAGTDFSEHPESQDFPNIHTEMELLVSKCGLTPLEAITTATRNGATALGIEKSYGTVTKGKTADLVILVPTQARTYETQLKSSMSSKVAERISERK